MRDGEQHRRQPGPNRAGRPARDGQGVKTTVEGRRPVPPKRRPPGPSGGGLALPTDGEARQRATDSVSRDNARAVFKRLRQEIESQ